MHLAATTISMYEIILYKSVGPFELGTNISQYTEFELEFFPKETEQEDWDSYSYKDGIIDICTHAGVIASIACRGDCFLNGHFLIGMNINTFFSLFNIDRANISSDVVYFPDDTEQDVYEIDPLGLQVWADEQGQIVTVFVSPYSTEQE